MKSQYLIHPCRGIFYKFKDYHCGYKYPINKNIMKVFPVLSLLILLGTVACKEQKNHPSGSEGSLQKSIEEIKLTDLSNKTFDIKQYKGKTVFINFWATWCKPCLEEMPSIQKAMDTLKNENIVFLFASEEASEQIEDFKKGHAFPFQFVRVENLAELNILALPTTFIFSKQGDLAFAEMGYRKWDDKTNIDLITKIAGQE